jgi:peroxiredoxin family protein
MKNTLKKVAIAVSMAASVGAIATAPAQAGSLKNATIGGTAASDYLVYDSNATQTYIVPNTQNTQANQANVQKVLDGDAAKPTGNVELRASSEQANFDFNQNTTLTGKIGGYNLTLSSLTATDWFGTGLNKTYGANNLANTWFNQFYNAAGINESAAKSALKLSSKATSSDVRSAVFNTFLGIKGFERSSDPNISYVNQDDNTGFINIGLAGHYDLKAAYNQTNASGKKISPFAAFAPLVKDGFQASEVVKYTYNGTTDYLYSFSATDSGLKNSAGAGADGISHSGNYGLSIKAAKRKVPEPSALLGLLGVAGIVVTQRKFNNLKKA